MSQPSSSAGTTARQPSLRRTNSGRTSPAPLAGSSSSASLSNASASATARKSSSNATSTAVGFEEDRGLVMREREREEKRSERDGTSVGRAAGVDVGVTRPKRRLSRCVSATQQDQGPGRGEIRNVSLVPLPLAAEFHVPVTTSTPFNVVHISQLVFLLSFIYPPANTTPRLALIPPSTRIPPLPPPCGTPLLLCHGLPRPFSPTPLDHPPPSLLPVLFLLLVLLVPAPPPLPSQ